MSFQRQWAFGLAALALSGCVETTSTTYYSDGQNRNVTIINNSGRDITHFYGSNAGASSWQEDILGTSILPYGSSVNINFDDGSGYCTFDFKVRFSDGSEGTEYGIDVCQISSYTIN